VETRTLLWQHIHQEDGLATYIHCLQLNAVAMTSFGSSFPAVHQTEAHRRTDVKRHNPNAASAKVNIQNIHLQQCKRHKLQAHLCPGHVATLARAWRSSLAVLKEACNHRQEGPGERTTNKPRRLGTQGLKRKSITESNISSQSLVLASCMHQPSYGHAVIQTHMLLTTKHTLADDA